MLGFELTPTIVYHIIYVNKRTSKYA